MQKDQVTCTNQVAWSFLLIIHPGVDAQYQP